MKSRSHLRAYSALLWLGLLFWTMTDFAKASDRNAPEDDQTRFRWEIVPIEDQAELLTLFFSPNATAEAEIPLISVVRDTLGSTDPEVHRLRYVWVHTYTTPSLKQRLAAGVPFLYHRFGNANMDRKRKASPMIDLSNPNGPLWKRIRGAAFNALPFYPKPPLFDTTVRAYSRNQSRYRNAQLQRASVVLNFHQAEAGSVGLRAVETRELQGRLAQAQSFLGHLLDLTELERLHLIETTEMQLRCSQNWELLRQRAEAEGLYFDPLSLPDGTPTHALLWVSKEDLEKNPHRQFDGRFLNIDNPWTDDGIRNWSGVTETRYLDEDNRIVDSETPNAKRTELIPLALYGLDHRRIPALLVDFRKPLNAKGRELSARARDTATDTLVPVSMLTKVIQGTVNFLTHRKGRDIFQPSRARSYSQLKTALALNRTLGPAVKAEVSRRAEVIADNPFENDLKTELKIARSQYESLLDFASQPNGLRKWIERDRRSEFLTSAHNNPSKLLLKITQGASLGIYKHRERAVSPLMLETQRRQLANKVFLRAVAQSGASAAVLWDSEKIRTSLQYAAESKTIKQKDLTKLEVLISSRGQESEAASTQTGIGATN